MRKSILFTILIAAITLLWNGCGSDPEDEQERPGSLHGIITDRATGEPIRAASVRLHTGTVALTGNDGRYEFTNLPPGEYTLSVTAPRYAEVTGHRVTIRSGQPAQSDIAIERLPPALRIVDGNNPPQNIDAIDFGAEESVVTRSFNIFNDGAESLTWVIINNATWITNISQTSGTLAAARQQPVVMTIDRELLSSGDNTYMLNVTSDDGSRELRITAEGEVRILPTLNTLAATNITTTTAMLNGEILTTGTPAYTERGFVFSLSPMPTLETSIARVTASLTGSRTYSATVTGLTMGQTYFVRAYAINRAGVAYSTNEIQFTPQQVLPVVTTQAVSNINLEARTVTFNGTIVNAGDPAYTERGFVFGTSRNPTIENDTKVVVAGAGVGAFSANVRDLPLGTYYIRAFATNVVGTVYGAEITLNFTSPNVVILQTAGLMVQRTDIANNNVGFITGNSLCQNSTLDGYTDWRLPTRSELAVLFNERNTIGGFVTSGNQIWHVHYWSSTYSHSFVSGGTAFRTYWIQNFWDGIQRSSSGATSGQPPRESSNTVHRVRCVRTLP